MLQSFCDWIQPHMVYPRPRTKTSFFWRPLFGAAQSMRLRFAASSLVSVSQSMTWGGPLHQNMFAIFFQIIHSEYQKRAILILSFTKTILEFTPTNFAHWNSNNWASQLHVSNHQWPGLPRPCAPPANRWSHFTYLQKKQRKKPQSCNFGQNPLMETWDVRGLGIATSEISDELFVGPKASVPGRVGSPPANNMDISKNTYSPLRWTRSDKQFIIYHNISQCISCPPFLSSIKSWLATLVW